MDEDQKLKRLQATEDAVYKAGVLAKYQRTKQWKIVSEAIEKAWQEWQEQQVARQSTK